jgi:SWI/SNF-related matrix-associated actin-dependent regulator 1 of chromatin subfamily A
MTTPKPYQMEGALAIRNWGGRALLADEMGLGKSFQALYWAMKTTKARPIVIVCPASLKYNWEREAARHVGMLSTVLEGRKPPKRTRLSEAGHPIFIVNYQILKAWLPYLRRLAPKCVIIDECHHIKNRKSKQYKATALLCTGVKHVIAISGTPLTNRPAELWATLNLILPDKYDSFFSYAQEYCKPKRKPWGWDYSGARNLDKLHNELRKCCMIRRLKKDVMQDLPPKIRIPVSVGIKDPAQYRHASTDFLGWLREKSPSAAARAKKAESMARVGYLLRLAARLKVPSVFAWIDEFLESQDGKLVVFSSNTPMIEALQRRYGRLAVTVNGKVKGRDRMEACDRFQNLPSVRLFFGNTKAAGVGLTLTAAQVVLFVDFPWTPGDLVQGEDRIHRIGQNGQCMVYYLVARGTIEEHLIEVLQEKQDILEQILDGKGNGDDLDVFDALLRKLSFNRKPQPRKSNA